MASQSFFVRTVVVFLEDRHSSWRFHVTSCGHLRLEGIEVEISILRKEGLEVESIKDVAHF